MILARIKRSIEIGLLARNPEFIRALLWEVDDAELGVDCMGPPPAGGEDEL